MTKALQVRRRRAHAAALLAIVGTCVGASRDAQAQTQLPGVVVTTPSPVAPSAPAAPAPAATPQPAAPDLGGTPLLRGHKTVSRLTRIFLCERVGYVTA